MSWELLSHTRGHGDLEREIEKQVKGWENLLLLMVLGITQAGGII